VDNSTAPTPAKLPTVSSDITRNVAPVDTTTAAESSTADPPVKRNTPAETVAPPVNVFAPPNVTTPVPAFVNENAPPNAPVNATSLAAVNVVFAVNVPDPPNVNIPLFTASPNVTAPPIVTSFANVRTPTPSLETVAPDNVTIPVPNASSSPA
jgi:hypothetical protein